MNRVVPMLLLCAGVVVASLFGARNGEEYAAYRAAAAADQAAELPGPAARLGGWFAAGGVGWGAGVALVVAGAVLARRQRAAEATAEGGDGRVDFDAAVHRLLAEVDALAELLEPLEIDRDHPEVRDRLDALAAEVIGPVVEGRMQLVARHGLGAFTGYFSPFSAGERNLARCWSAITDGHAVVAREALQRARGAFVEARAQHEAAEEGL